MLSLNRSAKCSSRTCFSSRASLTGTHPLDPLHQQHTRNPSESKSSTGSKRQKPPKSPQAHSISTRAHSTTHPRTTTRMALLLLVPVASIGSALALPRRASLVQSHNTIIRMDTAALDSVLTKSTLVEEQKETRGLNRPE